MAFKFEFAFNWSDEEEADADDDDEFDDDEEDDDDVAVVVEDDEPTADVEAEEKSITLPTFAAPKLRVLLLFLGGLGVP